MLRTPSETERWEGKRDELTKEQKEGRKRQKKNHSYDAAAAHRKSNTLFLCLIPVPTSLWWRSEYSASEGLEPLNIGTPMMLHLQTYLIYHASLLCRNCCLMPSCFSISEQDMMTFPCQWLYRETNAGYCIHYTFRDVRLPDPEWWKLGSGLRHNS